MSPVSAALGSTDLAPGRRCQECRARHPALPRFVVDRFEQAAVEGDVDPPRGTTVQKKRDQH